MSKNLKQLKQDYLAMGDLTEVSFANKHFGSLEDWYAFAEKNINHVSMWRKELELSLKQEAYNQVIETMRDPTSKRDTSLSAAKFLLSKGILTRDGEATVMATEEEVKERVVKKVDRVDNDYLRLMVNNAE